MYILSQITELIALVITLVSYHLNTKKKIFKNMCYANIFDIMHYLFLGAYSGCLTKIVALIRNIFIIKKENNNKLNSSYYLFCFILIYLILGILTYSGPISLFPFIAALIYMIVVWNGNETKIKFIAFLCYIFWLIYNIYVLSVMGIISNIISLISTYIAYYNYKRRDKNVRIYKR